MSNRSNEVAAMTSTGKDDWHTPPAVLRSLHDEFGFVLDAASSAESIRGVAWLGPNSPFSLDGLEPWPEPLALGGDAAWVAAWLNPPYSRAAGRGRGILAWHEQAWLESRNGWTVVLLCPPHPGRRWFHHYAVRADEVRVFKRRISFIDPATGEAVRGNTQDSCLVVYRPHVPDEGWPGGPRWSWIDVPKGEG